MCLFPAPKIYIQKWNYRAEIKNENEVISFKD